MKKTKLIAITLVVAIILMGASYAAWTDELTIKNTVKTGDLEVGFVTKNYTFFSPTRMPSIVNADTEGNINSPYMTSTISPDYNELKNSESGVTDELDVMINDMYPGSMILYVAMIKNLGTLAAKFDRVEVEYLGNLDHNEIMKDNLLIAGGFLQYSENNSIIPKDAGWFGVRGTIDFDPEGNDLTGVTLRDLEEELNIMFNGVVLEPGDYMLLDIPEEAQDKVKQVIKPYNPDEQNCIIYYLPEDVGNETESKTAQFKIKIFFKQFNK